MGKFDDMPYIFWIAKMAHDKTTLTYDDYKIYMGIWNDMPESMKKTVKVTLK